MVQLVAPQQVFPGEGLATGALEASSMRMRIGMALEVLETAVAREAEVAGVHLLAIVIVGPIGVIIALVQA